MTRVVNGITIPADVVDRGRDTYGRTIWCGEVMWDIFLNARWSLSFGDRLWPAQGPWQLLNGGGPDVSAHYHDGNGPFDFSVRDLTEAERIELVWWWRCNVGAAWRRGARFGQRMVDHIHADAGWADHGWRYPGLDSQWREYIAGGDGLTGSVPDYERRPSPLVLKPTRRALMAMQDDIVKAVRAEVANIPDQVWAKKLARVGADGDLKAGVMLAQTHNRAGGARSSSAAAARVVQRLRDKGVALTPDAIAAIDDALNDN